jgi:DNA invertase Pin-like site-specific DNA recombinase
MATFFVENESGATLNRPELFRLLEIAQPDDIILVEQIDRISRFNDKDWNKKRVRNKLIRTFSVAHLNWVLWVVNVDVVLYSFLN